MKYTSGENEIQFYREQDCPFFLIRRVTVEYIFVVANTTQWPKAQIFPEMQIQVMLTQWKYYMNDCW